MKKSLTDRQESILDYIREGINGRGHCPTIREIGAYFGITSTNGVRQHIEALIKKGYLTKRDHIARGMELTVARSAGSGLLPLVGTVPAGSPIDAIENVEGEIAVDRSFLPSGDCFTLRVSGDSMRDAGIFDGDIVVVKKQQVARKGDIVVAIIGEEATVKRYFPGKDKIRLQPENPAFDPIIVTRSSGEFRLAGKVVGLLRKLS